VAASDRDELSLGRSSVLSGVTRAGDENDEPAFPAGDLNIFFINYDGHFHDLLNDLDKELTRPCLRPSSMS
jgi:hypothetical protein